MRWVLAWALGCAGCLSPSVEVRPHQVPGDYREVAELMPSSEAVETLKEVLAKARADDPNRNDSPLDGIDATETHFEVVGPCFDADGHTRGRRRYVCPFPIAHPYAYEVSGPDRRTVYFVKFDNPYEVPNVGSWSAYPNLHHHCIWFSSADDVRVLFETVTCLKSRCALD